MAAEDVAELESLARRMIELERVRELAAPAAAPKLLQVARDGYAAGRGPDGVAWPPTKDGRVALTSLTSQATARADGTVVVLELPDELAYHQHPTQPGHPRRATLPEGDVLPAAWQSPLEDAVRAELERIARDGSGS